MTEKLPPEPFTAEIPITRIRGAQRFPDLLWVAFDPAWGTMPATLQICHDYDGTARTRTSRYTIAAHRWRGPVCEITLMRDPDSWRNVGPGGDRQAAYSVSIVGGSGWCSCRGFVLAGAEAPERGCKHIAALAAVVAAGLFAEGKANEQSTTAGQPAEPASAGTGREEDRGHCPAP